MQQLYRYKARTQRGELITGILRGNDSAMVAEHLVEQELIPVKVTRGSGFSLREIFSLRRSGVRTEDLIIITRQLSTLYRAGIPLLKSLEIASEKYAGTRIEESLLAVRDDLERGETLSDALAKHPRIFSEIYTASIRAAEATGKLDMVLDRLSEALERDMVTVEEIKKATRYPITVIVAIVAAFIALTTFVVPRFAEFYASYDTPLPKPTQIIIALGVFFQNSWYVAFPLLAVCVFVFIKALRHPRLKPTVDKIVLKLPVMGDLFVKTALSRFAHLLSVLIASGTPIITALEIVRHAVGNTVIGEQIQRLSDCQREGRSMLEVRHHLRHFPNLAISLIHVGLESGTLELTLAEISRFFDRDVQYASSRLTSRLEPVMILVIGGMVLFMALAIFLPMWNLITVFRS
ncbi:MAG: type II secretion system F family protein [bacterium]